MPDQMFLQNPIEQKTVFYSNGDQACLPENENWLTPGEKRVLSGFEVKKRRQDWLLGRWTAKSALSLLALPQEIPLDDWQITPDEDGAPCALLNGASTDLCISLSHSNGLSLCALASNSRRMGCDIEKIEQRNRSFEETFFTASELQLLEEFPQADRILLVTLIWSVKESVLKALRTGLRSDTRRIRVFAIETGSTCRWRSFKAEDSHNGDRFFGSWRKHGAMISTIASDHTFNAPVRL